MAKFASTNEQYQRYELLRKEDVASLLEWCEKQPHLPRITELEAALFLHRCQYNNERAKKRIDCYYTCRTNFTEFFAACDPRSAEIQAISDMGLLCVLPKRTLNGEVIFYSRLTNANPDLFNLNQLLKAFNMMTTLYLFEHGCSEGHVLVMDMEGLQLKHYLKMNILSASKWAYFVQNATLLHLKHLHFVNSVYFVDKILALVKLFLKKKLMDRIHVHYGSNETIFKYVPKEDLPTECGGEFGSLMQLFKVQCNHITENAAFFIDEESKRVDESKRPKQFMRADELFGSEGTFKMSAID